MSANEAAALDRREALDARTIALYIGFFASGFCSLLYQIIWTRLAFAHFGIVPPVLSVIVSVFMLGIGVGSIYGGRWAERLARHGVSPLAFWACMELIIAIGAFVVPAGFSFGETILLGLNSAASSAYLAISAVVITITILPWCIAMGTTVPVVMDHLRSSSRRYGENFSLLYLANVFGAMVGTLFTAIALIEVFGLAGTYHLAAIINLLIATLALILARDTGASQAMVHAAAPRTAHAPPPPLSARLILFATGLSCLGLEICWTRDFTLELQTTIYAFAMILATYLLATMVGTYLYRKNTAAGRDFPLWFLLALLFPSALLPVFFGDPRILLIPAGALLSIVPFSLLLGAVTPALIDRHAKDDPVRAGSLYAINIAGGIVGPLIAAYVLLPELGIRWAMILLSLPLLPLTLRYCSISGARRLTPALATGLMLLLSIFVSRTYDDASLYARPSVVHRGIVATAVAAGSGLHQMLTVNAIPITFKSIETQIMADLPMAVQGHAASALDICFGMGTTFRTLTFWGGNVTAVDLSAAVIHSFGFFYPDATKILQNPKDRVVVDDGRRFLMRTKRRFEVITLDPPPPIPAAGSSLLYSTEFYAIARRHLTPNGILQQWVPATHGPTVESIALALHRSFPYVEAFRGARSGFGIHFLASTQPIPQLTPAEFIARLPPKAARFLMQWQGANDTLKSFVTRVLDSRISFNALLPTPGTGIPALTDNRPFNEYYLLRHIGLMP